jgi:replication factor A1
MDFDTQPVEATVAELKPSMRNLTITFKVVEIGEEREITSRDTGEPHRVVDARVGDSSGTVLVPLWDDAIDNMEVGQTYKLTNGYTGLFRGNLRLNVGKYGQIADAEEAIEEVKSDLDMSAAEHEDDRPPRRDFGRGRSGGGYGGSSYGGDRRGGSDDNRGGSSGGGYGGRDRRGGGSYGRRDRR